jgi:stage IV sporulation protein B
MSAHGRRIIALAGAAATIGLTLSPPVTALGALPAQWEVPAGEAVSVPWSPWLPISVEAGRGVEVASEPAMGDWRIRARVPGHYAVSLKWFGWLPFRRLPVKVVKAVRVVPGGQSIGVVVHTRGLLVTSYDPLKTPRGVVDPAAEAGIQPGDVLLSANGAPLHRDAQLARQIAVAGARGGVLRLMDQGPRQRLERLVHPLFDRSQHRWEIGITVRDSASGVGTLSFWVPGSLHYAALGHSISDGITRRPVGLDGGQLMGADVVGVVAATPNIPGEKVGVLTTAGGIRGNVQHNGLFGLAGRLDAAPPSNGRPVPVAMPDQVKPGSATMLTVVHGLRPERFRIRILQAYPQVGPATKGLLFQITDPRLLRATGGVIQGMSGSPILQDGRLVGAVTHVLVSSPSLGYGCYAAWMLADLR